MEAAGGIGLVPLAALQHVEDDAAFAIFDDLEQAGIGPVLQRARGHAAAHHFVGQQIEPDHGAGSQHHRALNHVFQFADVARPSVIHQRTQGLGSDVFDRLAVLQGEFLDEIFHQQRNVFLAFAQRRQIHGDDVEAIEEILAEATFFDALLQIHVGGSDDAHIYLNLADATQMHELAVLEHSQDLGLSFQIHGADLIEKNRAAVGDFEQALLGSDGAGEGALDVAKQRGFQQVSGHGAGIHGNEWPVFARRVHVNGFGDQLLAGSALALDEHGGAAGGHLAHQIEYAEHGLALADDVFKVVALFERPLELDVFFFYAAASDGSAHIGQQLLVIPGFLDKIGGT